MYTRRYGHFSDQDSIHMELLYKNKHSNRVPLAGWPGRLEEVRFGPGETSSSSKCSRRAVVGSPTDIGGPDSFYTARFICFADRDSSDVRNDGKMWNAM